MTFTQAEVPPSAIQSGTPRTDSAIFTAYDEDGDAMAVVDYGFARDLEAELSAKQEKIEALMLEYCPASA